MKLVIQRVKYAKVLVSEEIVGAIDNGLFILLGITQEDSEEDITWLVNKVINLRIFNDVDGKMNLSLKNVSGQVLVVSQFTLFASTKKGNRPSYLRSAKPEIAIPLYEKFIHTFESLYGSKIEQGIFGADMKISLLNDGPVTIIMDSKNRE